MPDRPSYDEIVQEFERLKQMLCSPVEMTIQSTEVGVYRQVYVREAFVLDAALDICRRYMLPGQLAPECAHSFGKSDGTRWICGQCGMQVHLSISRDGTEPEIALTEDGKPIAYWSTHRLANGDEHAGTTQSCPECRAAHRAEEGVSARPLTTAEREQIALRTPTNTPLGGGS